MSDPFLNRRLRERAKGLLGPKWTTRLRCIARGKPLPRWGNLRRTSPFSSNFGFERGIPIDRFYLRRFLGAHCLDIRGEVLEIQGSGYTSEFGHDVHCAHTIDIDPRFQPTYLCDLAASDNVIPSNRYDCFLLPNTLCVLRDIEGCLRHALRVVRPGGVILASTAVFVPLTTDNPDYWHLSADGWREVAKCVWPNAHVEIESHGNCLAAVAAMMGFALEELRAEELEVNDPRYPVLVTILCRKPEAITS